MSCSRCGTRWRWDVKRALPQWYLHVPRGLRQPLRHALVLLQWLLIMSATLSIGYGAYQFFSWTSSYIAFSSFAKVILALITGLGFLCGGIPWGLICMGAGGALWFGLSIVVAIASLASTIFFSAIGLFGHLLYWICTSMGSVSFSLISTMVTKLALPLLVPLAAFILIAYLSKGGQSKLKRLGGHIGFNAAAQHRRAGTGREQAAAKTRENVAMRKMDHKRVGKAQAQWTESRQKWDMRVVRSGRGR